VSVRKKLNEYWNSFSYIGLVFATLFFAASVSPSLLPRPYFVQGILSGFAIAVGYSLGVACLILYQFLELPNASNRVQRISKLITTLSVSVIFILILRQMTYWQNSIRDLMEMPTLETAYPYRTAIIAFVSGAMLIAVSRLLINAGALLSRRLSQHIPRRIAITVSTLTVGFVVLLIGNGLVARGLLNMADQFFLRADELVDDGVEQPTDPMVTGSAESMIDWESIGRQGKNFIAAGPTQTQISEFLGREAMRPIRVYAGMRSEDTPLARAELALEELKRVKAFDRSILVVATPTGTGWLDPGAVNTLEYLHGGDTAIVSTQYSYLPSWITILVDPRRSIDSADDLFDVVYDYWKELPKNDRPKLYLQGLSLGSLGSEASSDLLSTFEDPIQGALWSGPPFPSRQWREIVEQRNPGTPQWLPTYRDGRIVRFTSQINATQVARPWGPIRNVYIQYASDPMVFFSTSLLYQKPAWLSDERGPDVSPYLTWFPIITFLQVAFDLPMATSIPAGYGHHYAPANYIDGWIAVTNPSGFSETNTEQLKSLFKPND